MNNEQLLAANNIKIEGKPIKTEAVSTAAYYQSWGLEIKGNQLWLNRKGKPPISVKTGDPEELTAIKNLFRPSGVTKYFTKQEQNGNCAILAPLQAMMLTGNHLEELIQAVSYDKRTKRFNVKLYDNDGKPITYDISKAQMQKYGTEKNELGYYTIARSSHFNLTCVLDLAFRKHATHVKPERKNADPLDYKNIDGNFPEFVTNSLIPRDKQNTKIREIGFFDSKDFIWQKKFFDFNDLAKFIKNNPNQIITVYYASPNLNLPEQQQSDLKQKGIVAIHAYTLLSIDEKRKTVTVVNPWDSSKGLVLNEKDLDTVNKG
jgi:hypothetical protein